MSVPNISVLKLWGFSLLEKLAEEGVCVFYIGTRITSLCVTELQTIMENIIYH